MDLKPILSELQRGRLIVLSDDPQRENEGDLIGAAQFVTPEKVAFMARHGKGLICAPLSLERAHTLDLPLQPVRKSARLQHCNFTVSVDAAEGITTGISAADRAKTIRMLADDASGPSSFSTPGHVFPLIGASRGVLERGGHTEATLDLLRFAGLNDVGVLCEIMSDEGRMLSGKELERFAKKHGLMHFSISELITHRRTLESLVSRVIETKLPTEFGDARIIGYQGRGDGKEHVALIFGKPDVRPLVRIHSECLTGDAFGSLRCDCHRQLQLSLARIGAQGGVLIYLRTEGRGIGLLNKLRAYSLQDKGLDTVEANEALGFSADLRDFTLAAHILKDLGFREISLMTNNPQKIKDLEDAGIRVTERVSALSKPQTAAQKKYLATKKRKMGHLIECEQLL